MPLRSSVMVTLRQPCAPLFQVRTWAQAQRLWVGTLLAPGRRTVSPVLQSLGRHPECHCAVYHQVLNRARWSARGEPDTADPVAGASGADPRPPGVRDRRDRRAAPRPPDRGPGPLPGRGAFLPGPLRPGPGAARDLPAGVDGDSLGAPVRSPSTPACAWMRPGSRGRPRRVGGPPAPVAPAARRSGHGVGGSAPVRVRWHRPQPGRGHRRRARVPCRPAPRAYALGAPARPPREAAPAGPALHRPGCAGAVDAAVVPAPLADGCHFPGCAHPLGMQTSGSGQTRPPPARGGRAGPCVCW